MKKILLLLTGIGLQAFLSAQAQSYLGEYQIQARYTLMDEDWYEENHNYVIEIEPCDEQDFDFQFKLINEPIHDYLKGRITTDNQFVLPAQQFAPDDDTTFITYYSGGGNFKNDSIFMHYYRSNPYMYGVLICDCKGIRLDAIVETSPSPWFPDGAEWYYGVKDITINGATGCIHMTATKDTLFAGRPCKQLKLEACDGKYETLYEYVHPCGDSLFYYNYADEDFFLLLDLSAKKGDTIWVHRSGFIPNPGFDPYQRWKIHGIGGDDSNVIRKAYRFMAYKIKAIDTVVMGGKTLRRQRAEAIVQTTENGEQIHSDWFFPGMSYPYALIVEGIGSLGGFWGESWGYFPEWGITWLRCFFAEGKTYMTDGKCDNAAVEIPFENPTTYWQLSPQPATERVQAVCEAAEAGLRSGNWRLVDAGGKALRRGTFSNGRFEVSLSGIPTGLYIVEITAANGYTCRLKCVKH